MSSVEFIISVHDGVDTEQQRTILVEPEEVRGLSLGEWLMSVLDESGPSLVTLGDTEVPSETSMLELCQKNSKANLNVISSKK